MKKQPDSYFIQTPFKMHFVAAPVFESQQAKRACESLYGRYSLNDADTIVVMGGDGTFLSTLNSLMNQQVDLSQKTVFGMKKGGHVGALINTFSLYHLPERIADSEKVAYHPLEAKMIQSHDGATVRQYAFNDVTMRRSSPQAAHIRVCLNGTTVLNDDFIGDGIICSTSQGSTGYYKAAGGMPFPLGGHLLGIKGICATSRDINCTVPDTNTVYFDNLEPDFRPVSVDADNREISNITTVTVRRHPTLYANVLRERVKERF